VALDELTCERNLLEVFVASLRISPSSYALPTGFFVAVVLGCYVILSAPSTANLTKISREWAESGIAFTTTMLGFLIAGFTIFASLGPSRMYRTIALMREQGSGLSYLKYTFFVLMRVFVAYLVFASLCFGVKMFLFANGPLPSVIRLIPNPWQETLLRFTFGSCFVLIGAGFAYTLLSLSSFIYNVSFFVMHIVRWEIAHPDPDADHSTD